MQQQTVMITIPFVQHFAVLQGLHVDVREFQQRMPFPSAAVPLQHVFVGGATGRIKHISAGVQGGFFHFGQTMDRPERSGVDRLQMHLRIQGRWHGGYVGAVAVDAKCGLLRHCLLPVLLLLFPLCMFHPQQQFVVVLIARAGCHAKNGEKKVGVRYITPCERDL